MKQSGPIPIEQRWKEDKSGRDFYIDPPKRRSRNSSDKIRPAGVGVIVVSDGKILTGTRNNDFGYGLICGPGGHVEEGETYEQAAIRETEEEFGISPNELIPLGYGPTEPDTRITPFLYLCTEYAGEPNCDDREIINPKFLSLEEIEEQSSSLFKPFKDGIDKLLLLLDNKNALDDNSAKDGFISEIPEKPIDKCSESGIVRVEGQQRADADKDALKFITVNGTHIPLVDGKAVGGPLKGEDFSKSKSEGKPDSKASAKKAGDSKKSSDKPKHREPKNETEKTDKTKSGSDDRQNKGTTSKPSSLGKNDRTTGFRNTVELEDHFGRHGKALGCSSKEEYQKRGIELLAKPCTDGIVGYALTNGKVVRFNTKTGEYVTGYPGQKLCTYMVPKDNKGVDLSRALDYYNERRKKDEAKFGFLK